MDKLIKKLKENSWIITDEKNNTYYKIETDDKNVIYSVFPPNATEPVKVIEFPIAGQWVDDYFILTGGGEKHTIELDKNNNLIYGKLDGAIPKYHWKLRLKVL